MRSRLTLVSALALVAALCQGLPATAASSVRINEASCSGVDWVELHNATSAPVDISNWVLSDRVDGGTAKHRFAIPRATVLGAGEFVVFEQGTLSNQLPWGIDCGTGEQLFLFSAMSPSPARVDSLKVPAAVAGFTYGRLSATASGHTLPTRGKANKDGRPSLTSPKVVKCAAGKACKVTLKASNAGRIALAKATAGVKLSKGVLTITARKRQRLTLPLRLSNAAGSRKFSLTVDIA